MSSSSEAPEDHSNLICAFSTQFQPGVLDGQPTGRDGDTADLVDSAQLGRIDVARGVESLELARDVGAAIRGVKGGDGRKTRTAGKNGVDVRLRPDADAGEEPHSSQNHPFAHGSK